MALRRPVLVIFALLVGGCSAATNQKLDEYYEQRAQALVVDYERARAKGDILDICVKATLVAGAYDDANRSGDSLVWNARRDADCQTSAALYQNATPVSGGP